MESKFIGIRALDMQTGLYKYNDSILDTNIGETILIGKAASLASHLRGIQVIEDFDALKALSSKLGINSTELLTVLGILEEIEYVRVIGSKRKPDKIEVLITIFEKTYNLLGEKWSDDNPDEFERKVIEIINDLASYSGKESDIINKYDLKSGETQILSCIGHHGGFLDSYENNGEKYLFSPIYMEENPQRIIDFISQCDEGKVKETMNLLGKKPGYPIRDIANIEDDILLGLMSSNLFPTPAINASGGVVNFLFAPFANTTDKTMVRHARNVVAAVRYGEKFSEYSALRDPALFLQRLLERGYIGKTPHSDIEAQYGVLRDNGLGRIENCGSSRFRFFLADSDYARDVVKLAKSMVTTNQTYDPDLHRGIIKEAWEERDYLSGYKFSEYIPDLSNIKNIKHNLNEKKQMPKFAASEAKINQAINRLFVYGGEPDVF